MNARMRVNEDRSSLGRTRYGDLVEESNDNAESTPTHATQEVGRAVGARVRELRTDLGMTMAIFAEAADISLGMLSKIEHAQTAPSLNTLVGLANAAGVPVTALFRGLDEEHDIVITRSGEGQEIIHEGSSPTRLYSGLGSLRGPHRIIEPMLTVLTDDSEEFPLFQHEGVEFIHILEGSMEYGYGSKSYKLFVGDTMQIHGEVTHGPVAILETSVRFLSIKVYPAAD
ncbi:MAG: transcriptional regulator with XRE-family HTH domain [Verrucomicrobiales bacterium]|jgi:transcriptional regulator with XRE-family HTH domain